MKYVVELTIVERCKVIVEAPDLGRAAEAAAEAWDPSVHEPDPSSVNIDCRSVDPAPDDAVVEVTWEAR